MRIEELHTASFRNLTDQTVSFYPQFNVICGDNGHGKTNLLEAVYLLIYQQSFRQARPKDIVAFGAQRAAILARVTIDEIEHQLKLDFAPPQKTYRIDDKVARNLPDTVQKLAAVLFTPDDLYVVRGSPADRRRLIDRAIYEVWKNYAAVYRDYQKVLQNRNRLLKDRPAQWATLNEVYEQQISQIGAKIVVTRKRYMKRLTHYLSVIFGDICCGKLQCDMRYASESDTNNTIDDVDVVAVQLSEALQMSRSKDVAMGRTTVGPHTDDVEFLIDQHDARLFGSQGEVRALMMAFRLGQIRDIYDQHGSFPILLLDDVSSELDAQRNEYLFNVINTIECQVMLTTARPDLLTIARNSRRFSVAEGVIQVWQ